MDRESLLEVKGSSLFGAGQKRLRIFRDGVEATQSRWPASPIVESMRHDQIASVGTHAAPMLHMDLVIESRGGARILVKNLARGQAKEAKALLEELLAGGFRSSARPPSADEGTPVARIRQLASLRDDGLLSDAEFQAKKTEILKRM